VATIVAHELVISLAVLFSVFFFCTGCVTVLAGCDDYARHMDTAHGKFCQERPNNAVSTMIDPEKPERQEINFSISASHVFVTPAKMESLPATTKSFSESRMNSQADRPAVQTPANKSIGPSLTQSKVQTKNKDLESANDTEDEKAAREALSVNALSVPETVNSVSVTVDSELDDSD
jgi:hypothetical protein